MIHTVGPVWHGGGRNERETLASCYRESLRLAAGAGLKRVAFPVISTGVYGYPKEEAAQVAVESVRAFVAQVPAIDEVIFACFSAYDLGIYERLLAQNG